MRKYLLALLLIPGLAQSQTVSVDSVITTHTPNEGRNIWNADVFRLRDSLVSVSGQNVTGKGRDIYIGEAGMDLQFNSLDSFHFAPVSSNLISIMPTGDGDTLRFNMINSLYPIDMEVGNSRIFGFDSTGQIASRTAGTPIYTGGPYSLYSQSEDAELANVLAVASASGARGRYIGMRSRSSTLGSPASLNNGNVMVGLDGWGYDGSAYVVGGRINISSFNAWDATHHGTGYLLQLVDTAASASIQNYATVNTRYWDFYGIDANDADDYRWNIPWDFNGDYSATFDTTTGTVMQYSSMTNGYFPQYNAVDKNFDPVQGTTVTVTSGQIPVASDATTLVGQPEFEFDAGNTRLSLGTIVTDAGTFHMGKSGSAAVQIIESWGGTSGLRFYQHGGTSVSPTRSVANSNLGRIDFYGTDNEGTPANQLAATLQVATLQNFDDDSVGTSFEFVAAAKDSDAADAYAFLTLQNEDTVMIFEGMTNDGAETRVAVTDPTGDRTITIPDRSGTVAMTSGETFTGTTTLPSTTSIGNASATEISYLDGTVRVKQTADSTFNTATQTDISSMQFAVTDAVYYQFVFDIIFQSTSATTVGIELGLTGPTTTSFGATVEIPAGADGVGAIFGGSLEAVGDSVMSTQVIATSVDYHATVRGTILPSASGILKLRFSSETGGAVIFRRGSLAEIKVFP